MNRIERIIEECAGGSVRRFAKDIGVDASIASRLKTGKAGISPTEGIGRFVERIYRAYPSLNAHWLLTGRGAMFKTVKPSDFADFCEDIDRRLARLEEKLL